MIADANTLTRLEHLPLPRLPTNSNGTGTLRRPESPRDPVPAAEKKTACGACGLIHLTWYDRKIRQVRGLHCGDMRAYPTLEIRRVDCRRCDTVKQEKLDWLVDKPFDTTRC